MNCPNNRVRLGRQEAEKVVRRFAFPDLPNRPPPRPDAGEKGERAAIVEREPNRRTGAVRQNLVLSEAGKGDHATTFDAEPSPPVGRFDVADVGDARIFFLACDGEGRRRHAPARHGEFARAVHRSADDRRGIVGEDAGQHRQIAREVAHGAGEVADGLLTLGDAVEIAHGRSVSPRRGRREGSVHSGRLKILEEKSRADA